MSITSNNNSLSSNHSSYYNQSSPKRLTPYWESNNYTPYELGKSLGNKAKRNRTTITNMSNIMSMNFEGRKMGNIYYRNFSPNDRLRFQKGFQEINPHSWLGARICTTRVFPKVRARNPTIPKSRVVGFNVKK